MYEYYVVVDKPIAVRNAPEPSAKIVNMYKPNSKVAIIDLKNGWLTTESGRYVLKQDNIIPYSEWKKIHQDDLIMNEVDPNLISIFPEVYASVGSGLAQGDTVKVSTYGAKDVVTGKTIPANTTFVASEMKTTQDSSGNNVSYIVATGSDGTVYNIPSIYASVKTANDSWINATQTATYQNSVKSSNTVPTTVSGALDSVKVTTYSTQEYLTSMESQQLVFGVPYQFLPFADNRIDGTMNIKTLGRKYAQKIAGRMPVLIMQAGDPEFMQGWSNDDKSTIANIIGSLFGGGSGSDSALQDVVNKSGKFYAFKTSFKDYYNMVNPMCHACASLLGLSGVSIAINGRSVSLGDANWQSLSGNNSWGYHAGSVAFYVNAEPQVSEGFDNSTSPSQLLQKLNDLGRMASEYIFLAGGAASKLNLGYGAGAVDNTKQMGQDMAKSLNSSGSMLDTIVGNVGTLMAGGRMAFPELWTDSHFMRSYNVNIKLDTPDCDPLSVYLNIFVPLIHILAFVAPRSMGQNNYRAPHIVRAYLRSLFHVDMGIITSCQITKGDTGAWTQNGLPTQVNVQLQIKDLYDVMSLSISEGSMLGSSFISNPAEIDYLANMCGVNIGNPDVSRTLKLWNAMSGFSYLDNAVRNLWPSAMGNLYNRIYNNADTLFNRF